MGHWFDNDRSTTNDVVRGAIITSSLLEGGAEGMALAPILQEGPLLARRLISHTWSNLFADTLASMAADALGTHVYSDVSNAMREAGMQQLKDSLDRRGTLKQSYWFCALSVNQHASICGSFAPGSADDDNCDTVTGSVYKLCQCQTEKHFNASASQCEINKFDDMLSAMSTACHEFRLVVAVDPAFVLFTRIWCIAEMVESRKKDIGIDLKFPTRNSLNDRHVLRQRDSLRVQNCEATRQDDVNDVLGKIGDGDALDDFNEFLQDLIFNEYHGLFARYQQQVGLRSTVVAEVCHVCAQFLGGAHI